MQSVILLALACTLTAANFAPRMGPGWPLIASTAAYFVLAAVLARLGGRSAVAAEGANKPQRANLWMGLAHLWLVLGSVALIEVGYARFIDGLLLAGHVAYWPLIDKVLLMLPFTAALLLAWTQEYPAFRTLRQQVFVREQAMGLPVCPPWKLLQYLGYNLRHQLLFIAAPAGAVLFASDLLSLALPRWVGWLERVLPPWLTHDELSELTALGSMVLAAGAVFVAAPAMIILIWRTQPLPSGPLREQMERICRGMGFRFRQILVWRTGGMITNAGVMGLIAPLRYVLLSDALLVRMDARQVEAVFAHEAGHVVSHHIFYSALFALGTLLMSTAAGNALQEATHWPGEAVMAIVLAALVGAWAFAFGFISRRFERQSDVIAACVMGPQAEQLPQAEVEQVFQPVPGQVTPEGAAVFASALQRVAELNGMSHARRNWRHGSIAWRVQYILTLGATGGTRDDIDRTVRWIKAVCWLLAAAAAGAMVWQSRGIVGCGV